MTRRYDDEVTMCRGKIEIQWKIFSSMTRRYDDEVTMCRGKIEDNEKSLAQ
jgi:hypothetical protein